MNKLNFEPVEILLVEDNPGDTRLTIEALKESKINNTLNCVDDGKEALDYLRKQGKYTHASTPDLILLDLDLPNMSGRELLEIVKKDVSLRRIPIVVLTISESDKDIIQSYDMQANAYVRKPIDLDQFVKVVQSIEDFWFTVVKYPSHN
ncbi:MAG: response regulator [Candidatus Saccharimonadales bacterium]